MQYNSTKDRMPPLLIDEGILLVDTYFQLKTISDNAEKKERIKELSEAMKSLPFYPSLRGVPEFRSFAGMQMCLANVGYLDPDNKSTFGHGSSLQRKVFSEYYTDQKTLHSLANAIKKLSKEKFPIDYSFSDCSFGMMLPSYHLFLERTNQTVNAVQNVFVMQKKVCALCGQDLYSKYKDFDLMEIHIDGPLYSSLDVGSISPSMLTPICPTCHKAVHSKLEFYSILKLKEKLGK